MTDEARRAIMQWTATMLVSCLLALETVTIHSIPALADEVMAFAVVSENPKDTARVSAKIAIDGSVADMRLVASEQILANLIWKKLEICHALKLEGHKSTDGFHVLSVRAIDAAMLPMVLQGFAGDCLLRKALDVAPFVD